jgi:DNA-binding MarR family transcriptional regulator
MADVREKIHLVSAELQRFQPQVTEVQLRILGLLHLRPEYSAQEIHLSIACGLILTFMKVSIEHVDMAIKDLVTKNMIKKEMDRYSLV